MLNRLAAIAALAVACLPLPSQAEQPLPLIVGHWSRAVCASMQPYLPMKCIQHVTVLARTADPEVRGFEITLEYRDAGGAPRLQSTYVKANGGTAMAGFRDVDDITITRVSAEPQKASGPPQVEEYR